MRRFVFVSHTGDPSGDWGLDDLCGDAGRVDVLCRNLQSSLFLSHDLRGDVEATLVFVRDADRPTAVRFQGSKVQRLNPDERSTAARIRGALKQRPEDPWWDDVEPGIQVAPFGLQEVLDDLGDTPVVLHKDGDDLEGASIPDDPVFLLGDHQPLTDEELALVPDAPRISLGPVWYHGNHVVSILQFTLDRRHT